MAGKVTKLEIGTVYQKTAKGNYYFRYQVNGQRKAVSLKTKNHKEAIAKAREMIPLLKATTEEVISVHLKQARGFSRKKKDLSLVNAWEVYSVHPERAFPATVSEKNAYKSTFEEFLSFVDDPNIQVNDITPEITDKFAEQLRDNDIAVHTHNRKIRRLKKIFSVLREYREFENPFEAKSLR
ncbi:MAG: phage integrase SAM-like domain-containing protein, partial [Victivallaceae bacterium]